MPACCVEERGRARDRCSLAARHCWESDDDGPREIIQNGWVVWDAEARVDSLEPEAQVPYPTWRASARDGHGSNFLCHQGAWPMYGRWSDSDSSLIKGRHFKQWKHPKPPVAFNGFNPSRFLGIAGQPVCRNAGEGFKDWEIPQETTRILQGLSLARYFRQALTF